MRTDSMTVDGRLPKVETKLGLMNAMEDMIAYSQNEDGEYSPEGRLRELKTYVLECHGDFPRRFETGGMRCEVGDTGLDPVKILRVREGGEATEFFLNMEDRRFLLLHTNGRSEDTDRIVGALTGDGSHTFDNVWLHSAMLKRLADVPGNSLRGFGVSYSGRFLMAGEGGDADAGGLNLSVVGPLAEELQSAVEARPRIKRAAAHSSVRIKRGLGDDPYDFVQDDVHSTGRFTVKRGKSVQDHLQLIDACREEYAETIAGVEMRRIGMGETEGKMIAEGGQFDFKFSHSIDDLDTFIDRMFSATAPFRMWGLKSPIHEGYFGVIAADLHAGTRMHFDIARDLMRVYLYKRGCGNTVLRLLTNLQLHYDAGTTCRQIS